MYCLDTSIIIEIFDGVEKIKEKLSAINKHSFCITPLALCELYKGAVHTKVMERRLAFIDALLQQVDLLEFTEHSCKIFALDYLKLKREGKPIKDIDLMIAAMCKTHNKILITTDKKHFQHIPELKVEVW
ncbi:type II toxin-antitoxin system VapC family toxin [Candidatus Woesearchaeota archaeon]|nr:type II toxin-antitoxin system VapC family toxin [Candidatus Woesearchaeota archaeon]